MTKKHSFYIQKGDFKVGDKVKIVYIQSGSYGKIGKVVGIELLSYSFKGKKAVNVEVKVLHESRTHLFGESASLENITGTKEKVLFT